jgi:voltage-gated potassium channel
MLPGNSIVFLRMLLRKRRTFLLLVSLLVLIILLPLLENSILGSIVLLVLFAFILLFGVYAISYDIRNIAISLMLAVPTFIVVWTETFQSSTPLLIARFILSIFTILFILLTILWKILSVEKVSIDEIYGAVCVYILIALVFSQVYSLLYVLSPSSFYFMFGEFSFSSILYFSFVALSSVGFGDIVAVTPLARAIVTLELIAGVIFVAVLIARLIGAMAGRQIVKEKRVPEEKIQFEQGIRQRLSKSWSRCLILVFIAVLLNFATSIIVMNIHIPFYLDSWGTSLAVIIGTLLCGVLAGVLYNILMAFTYWGLSYWVWMFSSILVAVLTWFFYKRGWVDLRKPLRLLMVGIITGVLNALLSIGIIFVFNLPSYEGTLVIHDFFFRQTGNMQLASLIENFLVEITDKTIAIILAAVVAFGIHSFSKRK